MTSPSTIIKKIAQAAKDDGKLVLAVGGYVRDRVLGLESKDIDLEVYGDFTVDDLVTFLSQFGDVDAVGKSFGVLKLNVDGVDLDVSVPRRENKNGRGHKGFIVEPDPTMTPVEAAARRDFTMNSMALNPLTDELIDPFDGEMHLMQDRLVVTGPAFSEDALRALRGFQFCGRFDLVPDDITVDACRALLPEYKDLPVERVWIEWEKWARLSTNPSRGLWFLMYTGWLHLYSELSDLVGCEQEPSHHPEGDTFVHTILTVDAMARLCDWNDIAGEDRAVLVLAALLHDVGKPSTTEFNEEKGGIRSYGHDTAGVPIAEKFLTSIGAPRGIFDRVLLLVGCHMRHMNFHTGGQVVKRHARRLANDLQPATVREWALVVEADRNARPPLSKGLSESAQEMVRLAKELEIEDAAPKPILMGRHLIEIGLTPGPQFGEILREAYEAQLDGAFEDLDGAIRIMTGKADNG